MASTYTSSLRLQLMADGDNSNTWGSTLNNGVYTLVDAAIAGTVTVAMPDSDYTLTANNGSTDEARRAVLNITGTITATRNVICPNTSKIYIIQNNTSGGKSVVLKTVAGTGVTVVNGQRVMLYCDGTNVVSAFTSVPGINIDGVAIGVTTQSTGYFTALRLYGSTSGYVQLIAPNISGTQQFTIPSSDGSNGQVLMTNGAGALTFQTIPGLSSAVPDFFYLNAGIK